MPQKQTEQPAVAPTAVRRRPRDRKAQILRVASRAFSERGYHPVGVDEIAAEVGISGPALYRHYPNKYALLVAAAENIAETLRKSAENAASEDADELPADQELTAILAGMIDSSIDNRRGAGLYRWERRYLEVDDRRRIRETYDATNAAVAAPLRRLRPELYEADVTMLVAALLSVIGSITGHRTALPANKLQPVLLGACWVVAKAELPPPPADLEPRPEPERGLAVTAKRELLINEALRVFSERGYHEASIEEIGAAAGLNASSVYRHFPSKADLLSSAFYRAADRLAVSTSDALADSTNPREALSNLADRYVRLAFSDPALLSVYFAEFGNLPAPERSDLRSLQRQYIEEWVHLLTEVRPGAIEARFRVHAALGLVLDLGRLISFDNRPESRARVHRLMTSVLLDGCS